MPALNTTNPCKNLLNNAGVNSKLNGQRRATARHKGMRPRTTHQRRQTKAQQNFPSANITESSDTAQL
jgi:hypothetical protein